MDYIAKLAVQSWCYRNYKTLPELAAAVKETGLNRIELCGIHCNFADLSTHKETVSFFENNGIKIVSTGVNAFTGSEAQARPLCEFAKAAGLKQISVGFDIGTVREAIALAERLGEEYDLNFTLHNHGGYNWYGSVEALTWIFANSSKRVGLMLDLAWAMQTGTSIYEYISKFSDRLYGVHLKDFSFNRAGRWHDEVLGRGNLDLAELKKALDNAGFNGEPVIEYEGDADNPVPALKECVAALKASW